MYLNLAYYMKYRGVCIEIYSDKKDLKSKFAMPAGAERVSSCKKITEKVVATCKDVFTVSQLSDFFRDAVKRIYPGAQITHEVNYYTERANSGLYKKECLSKNMGKGHASKWVDH